MTILRSATCALTLIPQYEPSVSGNAVLNSGVPLFEAVPATTPSKNRVMVLPDTATAMWCHSLRGTVAADTTEMLELLK